MKKVLVLINCILITLTSCTNNKIDSEENIQKTISAGITQTQEFLAATDEGTVSSDGWICFENNSDIWVMRIDGSELQNITNTENIWELAPKWSWDGKKIVYTDLDRNLYVINNDGTGSQKILEGELPMYPSWSPDGQKIIYSQMMSENGQFVAQLKLIDVITKKDFTILDSSSFILSPIISPDGEMIAFANDGIYTIQIKGTDKKQIIKNIPDHMIGRLAWSRDGQRIAFTITKGVVYGAETWVEYSEIYTVNSDGSDLQKITNNAPDPSQSLNPGKNIFGFSSSPAWTDNGKIVFSSNREYGDYNSKPYIMNDDGSSIELLVDQKVQDMDYCPGSP